MVITKQELIASLQNEVRILLHLAGKIDRSQIDYRPTPKQRSTIELLRYLSLMGPGLIQAIQAGKFDTEAWTAASAVAAGRDLDQTLAVIASHADAYASLLGGMSDESFRGEINLFGSPSSRGAMILNMVLAGCAAYRTQLFCYLKACGRQELGTMNLWAGMDAPAPS